MVGSQRVDDIESGLHRFFNLEIEVEESIGKLLERFIEAQQLSDAGWGADTSQLVPGEVRYRTLSVGCTVERVVVKENGNPIATDLDIGFNVAAPHLNGMSECRPGVLWRLEATPAVGEENRPCAT